MASKDKVREFFEAAELKKQYAVLTEQMSSQLKEYFESRGDIECVEMTQVQELIHKEVQDRVFQLVKDIFEEMFTDNEVDELTTLHASPVFKRMRELAPEMQQRLLASMLDSMDELEQKIRPMIDDILPGPDSLKTKEDVVH